MTILVLGGNGMAGHVIRKYLQQTTTHDVWWTVREIPTDTREIQLDASDRRHLIRTLQVVQPDIVINAIGILNQSAERDPVAAIHINSLLPHDLSTLGDEMGFRLIHISTDCVFSGNRGGYTEDATTDGTSVYAKTKSLGEVRSASHLTIRTSIVGPELKSDGIGLFHWFMQQRGTVTGFQGVYWNGVTTLELARFIGDVIDRDLHGLVHLCHPAPITKYELLRLFQVHFRKTDVEIVPVREPIGDKSLRNTRTDIGWQTSDYPDQVRALANWMSTQRKGAYPDAN